jgi:hypothetical protein
MLRYDVASQTEAKGSLAVGITRFHLVGAYGFLNNQLCIGAGLRMAYVDINEVNNAAAPVIAMFGLAPEIGLIVKPEQKPWRVGLTARAPVSAGPFTLSSLIREEVSDGTVIRRAGASFIVPDRIVQPWELEAGVAYQFGPRPLNPPWMDTVDQESQLVAQVRDNRLERAARQREEIAAMPEDGPVDRAARAHRLSQMARDEARVRASEDAIVANVEKEIHAQRKARYLNWPRQHVLVLASVLMTGPSSDAVALEGFIDQRRELVGARATLAPRFAIESEAIPNLLKTRAGAYLEPSRFSDGTSREHFTFGIDVRVFEWAVFGLFPEHQWSLSAFVDMAPRYQNFGFGVGTWH